MTNNRKQRNNEELEADLAKLGGSNFWPNISNKVKQSQNKKVRRTYIISSILLFEF